MIDLAVREERILLTEDKDFGQLIYASREGGRGVILLRYPVEARTHMVKAAVQLISQRGDTLAGRFVVRQPGRVRIGRRPGS